MENVSSSNQNGIETSSLQTSGYHNNSDTTDQYNGLYYNYGDDTYYYEDEPYFLKVYPAFELTILGIVRPILVLLTVLSNAVVVLFFLAKKKRGQSTNLLFVSIAFSDTMTGVLLLPNSFYVYAAENDGLTREWCSTYMILRLYFSPVFHTVSVWQTLLLGIQRYMCVCHPFISGRVCSIGKTILAIAMAYLFAFLLHIYHVLDSKITEVPPSCEWQRENPCSGMCVYLWLSVFTQHLLPCFGLTLLTGRTLRCLHRANRRLSDIAMSNRPVTQRSSREQTITMTSIAVVVVFLIPELPHGLYKLVLAIQAHGKLGSDIQITTETSHLIICIYEIALLVSFHANFWIYCSMMQDFRQALLRMASCQAFCGSDGRLSRLGSTSSRKNSAAVTLMSRTGSHTDGHRVLSRTTSVLSSISDTARAAIPMMGMKPEQNAGDLQAPHDDVNDDVFV